MISLHEIPPAVTGLGLRGKGERGKGGEKGGEREQEREEGREHSGCDRMTVNRRCQANKKALGL